MAIDKRCGGDVSAMRHRVRGWVRLKIQTENGTHHQLLDRCHAALRRSVAYPHPPLCHLQGPELASDYSTRYFLCVSYDTSCACDWHSPARELHRRHGAVAHTPYVQRIRSARMYVPTHCSAHLQVALCSYSTSPTPLH